ncbi:kinase subunit of RNA polymerase II carboxy-terminal domain kinase I [Steccherinum ochraceum]|uniref:Kinase subunit of RNA polymerase II carboxy-terminal domain kinase I n=1 Tax=Steccherinum ochraceum TaxID=92696 RepID=A0A4R0S122_9APHY|nr:kinase subunit of RNA polymerase II carboxy-terminal domain kinase I [Steccherinum ochraceum]
MVGITAMIPILITGLAVKSLLMRLTATKRRTETETENVIEDEAIDGVQGLAHELQTLTTLDVRLQIVLAPLTRHDDIDEPAVPTLRGGAVVPQIDTKVAVAAAVIVIHDHRHIHPDDLRRPDVVPSAIVVEALKFAVDGGEVAQALPLATSLEEAKSTISKHTLPQRPEQNGKDSNGKRSKRKKNKNKDKDKDKDKDRSKETSGTAGKSNDMPPPLLPASSSSATAVHPPSPLRDISPESSRSSVPRKNAGFKPIGQTSSAVKRFFPGDEDEDDREPLRIAPSKAPPSPEVAKSHFVLRPETDSYPPYPHYPPYPPPPVYDVPSHYQSRSPHDPRHDYPEYRQNWPPSPRPFSPRMHNGQRPPHPVDDFRLPYGEDMSRSQSMGAVPMGHYNAPLDTPSLTRPSSPRGSRDELYEIVSQVGEGTFGKVYKARNTSTGAFVALKRIRMETERDGFPVTAMREIKLLQSLRHPNIVRLYEMMVAGTNVYMVFEYMDHDLTGILSQNQFSFTDAHLKSLCRQMLAGLAYLHHKGVIHRDIKGSNILINNRGELKLGDFGLARFYQKRRKSDYTNRVITLWYRPPELLFGTTVYGPEVDMWSAGCIMLELFTKKPVFQGNDEIHQLDVVYKILGTPTLERWPNVATLPWYELVKPKEVIPNHFRELFQKWLSPAGLDLAERLLAYDPEQRATAAQALDAPYFNQEAPKPEYPTGLATLEGEWHELETKRERAKKRRKTEGSGPTQ